MNKREAPIVATAENRGPEPVRGATGGMYDRGPETPRDRRAIHPQFKQTETMKPKYLPRLPKPLLDDLVNGRWLPVVGAGLSKNAVLPSGRTMPDWCELGAGLAEDIPDYEYANDPIDAVSAYAHEYGRPKLIEALYDALSIGAAQPGDVHRAFCEIQFDVVCTTNFDFLVEKQYERTPRLCVPLIDEDQISIAQHGSNVSLMKLHGDLNHPSRLVATEEDYDLFHERYPVIATYLSHLFATRTPVLIGYSLNDPDFRQLWQVVGERIGKARRHAYALSVGAGPSEVARFERRGVKLINLDRNRSKFREVLVETFAELAGYWRQNVLVRSQVVEEEPLHELLLPAETSTRLCFLALPLSAHPFYREWVFPALREAGLVPVTADQVVSPGDAVVAKVDALISRAFLVVVDASTEFTMAEARMALGRKRADRTLIVVGEEAPEPVGLPMDSRVIRRPDLASVDMGGFLDELVEWLQHTVSRLESTVGEPRRLLDAGEPRAAVISAITRLEVALRERMDVPFDVRRRTASIRGLIGNAHQRELLGSYPVGDVLEWLRIRNEAVHHNRRVTQSIARRIVDAVEQITGHLPH